MPCWLRLGYDYMLIIQAEQNISSAISAKRKFEYKMAKSEWDTYQKAKTFEFQLQSVIDDCKYLQV